MRSLLLLFILISYSLCTAAQTLDTSVWITNGPVNAIVKKGNSLYIGGKFDDVGPCTGSLVSLDTLTGLYIPAFPAVEGQIYTMVRDGAGGFYIGGNFTSINGLQITHIAHILPGGALDTAFVLNPSGPVYALYYFDHTLYAGGSFNTFGGVARSNAAAWRTLADSISDDWLPEPDNTVHCITPNLSPDSIFIGGDFTFAGGLARYRIAKVSSLNGLVAPNNSYMAWNYAFNNTVRVIALKGDTVFAGGSFTTIGTSNTISRPYIAAISRKNSSPFSWTLPLNGPVYDLFIEGNTIYAAGAFTQLQNIIRKRLLTAHTQTALLYPWNPEADGTVYTLFKKDSTFYLGGDFATVNTQPRKKIAQLDGAGNLLPWDPHAANAVRVIIADNAGVYAGGDFLSVNGADRNNLAKIDLSTGTPNFWNPGTNNTVLSLDTLGSTLYVGGYFTAVGNQQRNHIAAIDLTSGGITSWNPGINGPVYTLQTRSNEIYAGGLFSSVANIARNNFASIDVSTGAALPWNPDVNGTVNDIAVSNNDVYLGGYFSSVHNTPRNYIAALSTVSTNIVTSWNPDPDNGIYALAHSPGKLFAGGWFDMIGGEPRYNIAAIEESTGSVLPWTMNTNSTVKTLFLAGDTLYAGGDFTEAGNQTRNKTLKCDANTGALYNWDMSCGGGRVNAIHVSGNDVYTGGAFTTVKGKLRPYFAIAKNQSITSVNEINSAPALLKVFPNPCTSEIYLSLTSCDEVTIINNIGQRVLHQRMNAARIDVSALTPGIYFVIARNGKDVFTSKFIKQ